MVNGASGTSGLRAARTAVRACALGRVSVITHHPLMGERIAKVGLRRASNATHMRNVEVSRKSQRQIEITIRHVQL